MISFGRTKLRKLLLQHHIIVACWKDLAHLETDAPWGFNWQRKRTSQTQNRPRSPTKGCRPLGRRDGQKHLGFPSIPVTSRREVRLFPNFYCWGTIKNPFKSLEIPLNHRLNLILTMKCNRSSISGYWFEPSWKINISQWEGWHPTYYGK